MMSTHTIARILPLPLLIAACLGSSPRHAQAAPLAISESPLIVSTTVQPNVMLLMDNSGSMNNIIWPDAYNPSTAYTDWSNSGTNYSSSSGNNLLSGIRQGNCASDWKEGISGSTTKCLRLPDPVGSNYTRYTGNYLNYLFSTYADGTDLTTGTIPNASRMVTGKSALTNFVNNTPGMRFGVASFNAPTWSNSANGGKIDAVCGSSTSTVTTAIAGLSANSWTPLAESLYEITRYFSGITSAYNSNVTYTSPIQYRCQKNFAIVVTDGLPTYDNGFPTDDPADVADTSAALPNWDNLAPATPVTTPQIFPQYSDGTGTGDEYIEGYSLFLDDIAKFGYDIDMRTSGNDASGGSFQDPNFLKQNMRTYTIGFSIGNQMLQDAAQYGSGLYTQANSAGQLSTALQSALSHVFSTSSSASSVATNSTRLGTDTKIYQAKFSSVKWSGELLSYPVQSNGQPGAQSGNAATVMPAHGSRAIYTYRDSVSPKGINFVSSGCNVSPATATSLSTAQQTALNTNISGTVDNDCAARVNYLRGDRVNEITIQTDGSVTGKFRSRQSTLGDIVNSDPLFVGTPDYRYHLLPGTEGTSYTSFRDTSSYKSRNSMIYVGANDGMLHAFNASTLVEHFAFIPNAVFSKLSALTSPNYAHTFFVDGSPRAGDAYIGDAWKTVLVSGLGAGGKAIFALDITNPGSFDGRNVMWEFTHAELGSTYSQPTIVRLRTGQWAAIFGNGYNSTSQTARLFIVNLADGSLIEDIDTGVGSATATGVPNGLSSPVPVDVDNDRITDYVYAGDLYGNMWKFDLTQNNSSNWDVAYKSGSTNLPLFRAVDGDGNGQPITARPEVGSHTASGTAGGTMVYFGTGKYFEMGDNTVPGTPPIQSFYGIRDNGTSVTGGRSDLQQQSILAELSFGSNDLRIVSQNTVAATKRGWYMDLITPPSTRKGERVVSNAVLRAGRIIFTTLIPDPDACGYGGTSWLMEMNAQTGARLSESVFDINGDGVINNSDFVSYNGQNIPPSGIKSKEGIIDTPNILGAGEKDYKIASGSTGNVEVIQNAGDPQSARQSWRQLQ